MATIQEQLELTNKEFEHLHNEFALIDSAMSSIRAERENANDRVRRKFKTRYDSIVELRENVDMFYRIALENTKATLPVSASPLKPDIAKLNDLASRVDSYSRNDSYAASIVKLVASYFAWLDIEEDKINREVDKMLSIELSRLEGDEGALSGKRARIIEHCNAYLNGPEVARLVMLFSQIDKDYGIEPATFTGWGSGQKKRRKMMLYGYKDYYLDAPKTFRPLLKQKFGQYYDQDSGNVKCPCGFTLTTYENIIVEYNEKNEEEARRGIQALVVNFLRHLPSSELKVSLFDYVRYGSAILGPLSVFASTPGTQVDQTPNDEASLKSAASSLCEQYKRIDRITGSRSVYEYNASVASSNRIPLRLLIINRKNDAFSNSQKTDLDYLLYNADKFGIFVVRLEKSTSGGSKGTDREEQYLSASKNIVHVICDRIGNFFVEDNVSWMPFRWLIMPNSVQDSHIEAIAVASRPQRLGTEYFNRYKPTLPKRSRRERKRISIPFAINENDSPIECSFENENFAAYLMGAAGSGKSTLLHTIITGLMMNYHPDEVELWLIDFKMTEFKQYGETKPPHVKYVLLEKSEDLVYDIVDRLTAELDRRQRLFSQNHWDKLSQVPLDRHIPALFVIIDEFAQMSQILKDTAGSGHGSDYTLKLENLLSKGRALGFKFIFASQTFTSGVSGLTETARKQIQMRFAMKNTVDEIKQTLALASHEVTETLSREMASLAPYRTLYKYRDEDGAVRVGLFDNLYISEDRLTAIQKKLRTSFNPVGQDLLDSSDNSFLDKRPVCIDGSMPQSFRSQTSVYAAYERAIDYADCDEDDVFIYPGVPCSFDVAKPFVLSEGASQNILLVGGKRNESMSVVVSILQSWKRSKKPITICAHKKDSIWRRYKTEVFSGFESFSTIDDVCQFTSDIKTSIVRNCSEERLVVFLGLERLFDDLALQTEFAGISDEADLSPRAKKETVTFEQIVACADPEERKRLIAIYNGEAEDYNAGSGGSSVGVDASPLYDARDDIKLLLKVGSSRGVHYLVVFGQPGDCISMKLPSNAFKHRILFGMSKSDSIDILGSGDANDLEEGRFLYSDGHKKTTMRPHLHARIPLHGYELDRDGTVVRRDS